MYVFALRGSRLLICVMIFKTLTATPSSLRAPCTIKPFDHAQQLATPCFVKPRRHDTTTSANLNKQRSRDRVSDRLRYAHTPYIRIPRPLSIASTDAQARSGVDDV